VPRANLAVSTEHPDGTTQDDWASKNSRKSVVEQHVKFFDPDGDGVIWPLDTFRGFHQLGYHFFWCFIAIFMFVRLLRLCKTRRPDAMEQHSLRLLLLYA
jgi:hypothetical protein